MAVPTLQRCRGQMRNRKAHSAHPKHPRVIGAIMPNPHFLCGSPSVAIGGVLDSNTGSEYEISMGFDDGVHVVSRSTGTHWCASLDELIDLAIAAGIDREGD